VALAAGFFVSPAVRSALVTSEDPKTVVALLRGVYARRHREAA